MLPEEKVIALYTHAAIFVCPSVYEPFGIINLEAMACETPVVASRVGGIPEVVEDGETGSARADRCGGGGEVEPRDPEPFSRDLATRRQRAARRSARRAAMAAQGAARVEQQFSWTSIARQTLDFYEATRTRSSDGGGRGINVRIVRFSFGSFGFRSDRSGSVRIVRIVADRADGGVGNVRNVRTTIRTRNERTVCCHPYRRNYIPFAVRASRTRPHGSRDEHNENLPSSTFRRFFVRLWRDVSRSAPSRSSSLTPATTWLAWAASWNDGAEGWSACMSPTERRHGLRRRAMRSNGSASASDQIRSA
jgi:hypothetical protein